MDSLLSGIMEKLLLTSTGKVMRTAAGKILRFSQPDFTPIKYGLLYNWYAATDARGISSSADWVVPSDNDFTVLQSYLDPFGDTLNNIAGGKLKETGLTYWNTPNTGATNEVGFNGRGAGFRDELVGSFSSLRQDNYIWSSTEYSINSSNNASMYYDIEAIRYGDIYGGNYSKKFGASLRLLYTGSGSPTSYTGNDGKIYPVVLIGTQRWISMNLAETKYRDGSTIPNVTDNTAWAALTTGACCAYNNDPNNV